MDELDDKLKSIPKPILKLEMKQKMYEKIISPKEAMADKVLVFLLSIIFIYVGFIITGNFIGLFIYYPISELLSFFNISDSISNTFMNIMEFIRLLIVIIVSYVLAAKVSDYVTTLQWSFIIKLILTFIICLIIAHKLFAPYFYTDQYLKNRAEAIIERHYEIFDIHLTEDEYNKKSKKVYGMKRLLTDHYKREVELVELHEISFERRYARFFYKVAVTEKIATNGKEELTTNIITYEFYSKNGIFYMNGWSQ